MEHLDCTLRDGGYYTAWDFEQELVEQYLDAMAKVDVHWVELGYRSPLKEGYHGQFFYLSASLLEWSRSRLRPDQKLALMVNAKDVDLESLSPCLRDCRDHVDMVRMAIPPSGLAEATTLFRIIRDLGFETSANLMYLSDFIQRPDVLWKYMDGTLEEVDYVYLVDSYGACYPEQVGAIVRETTSRFPNRIGFHGHDNLTLAFANTLAAIDAGAAIVDSTIQGMGRGAGNLRTELILSHRFNRGDLGEAAGHLSAIVDRFSEMRKVYEWGTDLPYIISGLYNLPQKDIMEWASKRRYNYSSIVDALMGRASDDLDREVYGDLSRALPSVAQKPVRNVMLVGGGDSVHRHLPAIIEFAELKVDVIVHSSARHMGAMPRLGRPSMVCLPGNEIDRVQSKARSLVEGSMCFLVSRGPRLGAGVPPEWAERTYEVAPYIPEDNEPSLGPVDDISPLSLALGACVDLGAQRIFVVGFDGYQNLSDAERVLAAEVEQIFGAFRKQYPETEIVSVTPTRYRIPSRSIYGMLLNS